MYPDMPYYFAEYAAAVTDRLSDRVKYWITQNEPQCYIGAALENGQHAPGLKLGKTDLFCAAHCSLLSHGNAVQVIRARARKNYRDVFLYTIPEVHVGDLCV